MKYLLNSTVYIFQTLNHLLRKILYWHIFNLGQLIKLCLIYQFNFLSISFDERIREYSPKLGPCCIKFLDKSWPTRDKSPGDNLKVYHLSRPLPTSPYQHLLPQGKCAILFLKKKQNKIVLNYLHRDTQIDWHTV